MKWYKEQNISQFKRFSKEIFNSDDENVGIEKLENWFAKIGAPITLAELNIPKNRIEDLAINANELATVWGFDKLYPKSSIIEILEKA